MSKTDTNLRAILKLKESRGWSYMREVMQTEIVNAAMNLGSGGGNISEGEMHYRRGCIFAAKQLMELPDKLVMHLESEAALQNTELDDAKASPDSPIPLRPEGVSNG